MWLCTHFLLRILSYAVAASIMHLNALKGVITQTASSRIHHIPQAMLAAMGILDLCTPIICDKSSGNLV